MKKFITYLRRVIVYIITIPPILWVVYSQNVKREWANKTGFVKLTIALQWIPVAIINVIISQPHMFREIVLEDDLPIPTGKK